MRELKITDDLDLLFSALPPRISESLREVNRREELLEVVLDLGREPEARFPGEVVSLSSAAVTSEDLDYVVARVGDFTDDNRAGIERTLHRISAIRNRQGRVVGLTCRIGRCVYGTVDIIRDVVDTGRSILLLGRPGIGKTTKLREVARILADDLNKRVVIVDTSNEIAGDGDIPHPGIGRARRMQVPRPHLQHAVMIEAVENHMPEVIVIDEIGTEAEALAARTIAERGVQLIGTAHGNTLDNLIVNPTLSDLIGGIHAVTLSDEEAKRRGTQKTVLERKAPPTFDAVIEILEINKLAIHHEVSETVDAYLRGFVTTPEIRELDEHGEVHIVAKAQTEYAEFTADELDRSYVSERPVPYGREVRIFPYGVSRNKLERALHDLGLRGQVVKHADQADVVLTLKAHYRRDTGKFQDAVSLGIPVHVVRSNTYHQMLGALREIFNLSRISAQERALQEVQSAIEHVLETSEPVELAPQSAYLRRLQHQLVNQYSLQSQSVGAEPTRRLRVSK
ncbi:MAG: single-stranded DNA-binding protein [Armatimonadetes bacterium]|nr:single-stranded DNA-binding protein [Armatimonadota bacterium]